MSKRSHLLVRNELYYFRIKVPTDLKRYIPSKEIKKALKTRVEAEAKEQVTSIEHRVQKSFRLLRSGLLSEDQVRELVNELFPSKKRDTRPAAFKLSDMICRYIAFNEKTWVRPRSSIASDTRLPIRSSKQECKRLSSQRSWDMLTIP